MTIEMDSFKTISKNQQRKAVARLRGAMPLGGKPNISAHAALSHW